MAPVRGRRAAAIEGGDVHACSEVFPRGRDDEHADITPGFQRLQGCRKLFPEGRGHAVELLRYGKGELGNAGVDGQGEAGKGGRFGHGSLLGEKGGLEEEDADARPNNYRPQGAKHAKRHDASAEPHGVSEARH